MALDCFAPGQAIELLSELIKHLEKKEKQNSVDTDVRGISRLTKLYEEANSWFTKRQILE